MSRERRRARGPNSKLASNSSSETEISGSGGAIETTGCAATASTCASASSRSGACEGVAIGGGTGAAARLPGLEIAGKTGTAQTIANSKSEKGQDHAWFASFAPAKDPEVVVVVMVEGGGHGGSVAAPIARQIYQAIFLEKVAMAVVAGDGS